jgi:hypothetical protein
MILDGRPRLTLKLKLLLDAVLVPETRGLLLGLSGYE